MLRPLPGTAKPLQDHHRSTEGNERITANQPGKVKFRMIQCCQIYFFVDYYIAFVNLRTSILAPNDASKYISSRWQNYFYFAAFVFARVVEII